MAKFPVARFLHSLLGPSESLLLYFDHLAGEAALEFEEQLDEVGRYYQFGSLSELVRAPRKRNSRGMAAVVLAQARKSIFLKAIPSLCQREIPFTLLLQPDCIGLNRLPPEEELSIYREHYPDRISADSLQELREVAWQDPGRIDAFLHSCRREIGPLPVERLDPTSFFVTWGKILELPPRFLELGLHLTTSPLNSAPFESTLAFVRRQVGRQPRVAFSGRHLAEKGPIVDRLKQLGFEAMLTTREGVVTPSTDPWDLPVWKMKNS